MRNIVKYLIVFIFVFSLSGVSFAEMTLSDGMIKRIDGDKNTKYVTFSWKVRIQSDHEVFCFYVISLRDSDDMEFHRVMETVHIKEGENLFTGTDIIESKLWFTMKSAPMRLQGCIKP